MLILNMKIKPNSFKPKSIAVYIKNDTNLQLMLMCATAIAEKHTARISLIAYLQDNYSKYQKQKLDKLISESILSLKSPVLYDIKIEVSNTPHKNIIELSSELDMLIIGKDERAKNKSITETASFQISQKAKCSVLMVKSTDLIKKITQMI